MPDSYSQALEAIVSIRKSVKGQDIATRIKHVFAPVDSLPAALQIEPKLCRVILQTLHDLGEVLWYKDLGVDLFRDSVILDPLILIDFIRQVINYQYTGQIISHADLKSLPFWVDLNDKKQMKAMKQVLQAFHLVYSADDDRIMEWDSDLIVPASWQTKTPAAWLFLGDILRIDTTMSKEGEAVRVDWEYHFEYGLPSPLFDRLVLASVSHYVMFDAGPDWILYEEKGVAACRIMVGRDVKSLHRTIHVEAVVSEIADKTQVARLWGTFKQLCGAFVTVMRGYPGLAVSSFAWDDAEHKINMKTLVKSPAPEESAKWMPPAATWEWFRQHVAHSHRAGKDDFN
jgi:hypothetical protein